MLELAEIAILIGLVGLALFAYSISALDRKGAFVSFLLGALVALLGGLGWLALMVAFTVLGVLATRIGHSTKQERRVAEARGGERGAQNVLANGAAATLAAGALLLEGWIPYEAAALAFATAVAAVTADTLASEIGSLQLRARRIVPPFPLALPGENGAVSWAGQVAAGMGASAIAALAIPLLDVPWALLWIPALGGFLGCQLDSLLGATLEGDQFREGPLSKGDVNFLASAVPALLVLVVASL